LAVLEKLRPLAAYRAPRASHHLLKFCGVEGDLFSVVVRQTEGSYIFLKAKVNHRTLLKKEGLYSPSFDIVVD
jgi:hypothetical protein